MKRTNLCHAALLSFVFSQGIAQAQDTGSITVNATIVGQTCEVSLDPDSRLELPEVKTSDFGNKVNISPAVSKDFKVNITGCDAAMSNGLHVNLRNDSGETGNIIPPLAAGTTAEGVAFQLLSSGKLVKFVAGNVEFTPSISNGTATVDNLAIRYVSTSKNVTAGLIKGKLMVDLSYF